MSHSYIFHINIFEIKPKKDCNYFFTIYKFSDHTHIYIILGALQMILLSSSRQWSSPKGSSSSSLPDSGALQIVCLSSSSLFQTLAMGGPGDFTDDFFSSRWIVSGNLNLWRTCAAALNWLEVDATFVEGQVDRTCERRLISVKPQPSGCEGVAWLWQWLAVTITQSFYPFQFIRRISQKQILPTSRLIQISTLSSFFILKKKTY